MLVVIRALGEQVVVTSRDAGGHWHEDLDWGICISYLDLVFGLWI